MNVDEAMYQPGQDGNTGKMMKRVAVLSGEIHRLRAEVSFWKKSSGDGGEWALTSFNTMMKERDESRRELADLRAKVEAMEKVVVWVSMMPLHQMINEQPNSMYEKELVELNSRLKAYDRLASLEQGGEKGEGV